MDSAVSTLNDEGAAHVGSLAYARVLARSPPRIPHIPHGALTWVLSSDEFKVASSLRTIPSLYSLWCPRTFAVRTEVPDHYSVCFIDHRRGSGYPLGRVVPGRYALSERFPGSETPHASCLQADCLWCPIQPLRQMCTPSYTRTRWYIQRIHSSSHSHGSLVRREVQ